MVKNESFIKTSIHNFKEKNPKVQHALNKTINQFNIIIQLRR